MDRTGQEGPGDAPRDARGGWRAADAPERHGAAATPAPTPPQPIGRQARCTHDGSRGGLGRSDRGRGVAARRAGEHAGRRRRTDGATHRARSGVEPPARNHLARRRRGRRGGPPPRRGPPPVAGGGGTRRLGTISLGGAAVAGALMIALALGPHTPSIVSAEPFPAYVSHGGGPAFTLGGETQTSGDDGVQTAEGGGRGGNPPSGGLATSDSGFTSGTTPHGSIGSIGGGNRTGAGNGTGGSSGGSGTGTGGTGGTGAPGGPHSTSSHLPGAHGAGKAGAPGWQGDAPGRSGNHNPHGGPPGHEAVHGSSQGNAHGGGRGDNS